MRSAAAATAAGPTTSRSTAAKSTSIPPDSLRIWVNHNSDDLPAIYKALQESGLDEEMAAYLIAAKIYTRTQLDAQGNPLQMGKGKGGGKKGGKNQKISDRRAGRSHQRRGGEPQRPNVACASHRQLPHGPHQHARDAPQHGRLRRRSASASKRRWSSTPAQRPDPAERGFADAPRQGLHQGSRGDGPAAERQYRAARGTARPAGT